MRSARVQSEILALAILLIAGSAHAQNYNLPWCAILDDDGNLSCAYDNEQQCLATLSGVGGECVRNPSPSVPAFAPGTTMPNSGPGSPLQLDPGPPPGLDGSTGPGPPPN
jgi:hypothetical protein